MKKIITIILTAILFVAAAALGIDSVYRVDEVALEINYVSEDAKSEAAALKKELTELYKKQSVFRVNEEDSKEIFARFPYFRLTDFKKEYPDKLIVEATEDAEVFAVKQGEEYYILSLDGTILSVRNSPQNRSDGKDNVLIEGMEIAGDKGTVCQGEKFLKALPFLKELSIRFDGLRSNLVKVGYELKGGAIEQFNVKTREGVEIRVQKIEEFTQEKAEKVAQAYLGLQDVERLTGYIYATNGTDKVTVAYYPSEIPFE